MRYPVNSGTAWRTASVSGKSFMLVPAAAWTQYKFLNTSHSFQLVFYKNGIVVAEFDKCSVGFGADVDFDRFDSKLTGNNPGAVEMEVFSVIGGGVSTFSQNAPVITRPQPGVIVSYPMTLPAVDTGWSVSAVSGSTSPSVGLMFTNNDAAAVVRLSFGAVASALDGVVILPNQTERFVGFTYESFSFRTISTVASSRMTMTQISA